MAETQTKPRTRVKAASSGHVAPSVLAPTTNLPVAQAPAETRNVLAIIAQVASDPKTNPENMRALLDMQKEIMAETARRDFIIAFTELQRVLPSIGRDGKIIILEKTATGRRDDPSKVQQNTPFSTYNNIMTVCKPIMNPLGFTYWSEVQPTGDGRILVIGHLDHTSGHTRSSNFPLPADPSGGKNNIQGWGSAQSYGKRYNAIALLDILSLYEPDVDTDGNVGKYHRAKDGGLVERNEIVTISRGEREIILVAIEDAGITEAQFCAHYGISKIEDLPLNLFEPAKKKIAIHKAERKNAAQESR